MPHLPGPNGHLRFGAHAVSWTDLDYLVGVVTGSLLIVGVGQGSQLAGIQGHLD